MNSSNLMSSSNRPSKSMQYYMRLIHRLLGYLTVGLVMVYSLSGITLIYRTGDFMKKGEHVEQMIEPGMSPGELGAFLKMKNFKATSILQMVSMTRLRVNFPMSRKKWWLP